MNEFSSLHFFLWLNYTSRSVSPRGFTTRLVYNTVVLTDCFVSEREFRVSLWFV